MVNKINNWKGDKKSKLLKIAGKVLMFGSLIGGGCAYLAGNAHLPNSQYSESPKCENHEGNDSYKRKKITEIPETYLPHTIPGTNKAEPEFIKSQGLPPENYRVKPHPYKKDSFLVVKDNEKNNEQKADLEGRVEKLILDVSSLEPGNYIAFIEKEDYCEFIKNSKGEINGKFSIPMREDQIKNRGWVSDVEGTYELYVDRGDNKPIKLGEIKLKKGYKILIGKQ